MKRFGAALLEEVLESESKILDYCTSSSDSNIIYPLVQDGWDKGEPNLVNSKIYSKGISMDEVGHAMLYWLISKNVVLTIDKNSLSGINIGYSIQPLMAGNANGIEFNKVIIEVTDIIIDYLKKKKARENG